MYKFILFLGICSTFASASEPPKKLPASWPKHDNKSQKILGCYYSNTEQDETIDPILKIEMINATLCTHLFYSHVLLERDASLIVPDNTDMGENGGYQRINNLRKKNRNLKILVGMQESFREAGDGHNKILFDPTLREKLVNNIVNFVQKYNMNGIELESQYLLLYDAVASDKENFISLLKELKEKFDKNGLILSLAVDCEKSTAKKYDIKEISKYVNFINLGAYYFDANSHDNKKIGKAGHVAPLYHSSKENTEDRKLNVDYMVKLWLSEGAPPNKLILGTTFKGMYYTLTDPKQVGRGAPFFEDPVMASVLTSYSYHCLLEKDRTWTPLREEEQQGPYIYKGKEMIAYENVASIKRKAEYAVSMKLAGVSVSSIEDDDISGRCGGGKSPLLHTVNQVLRDKC